MKKITKESAVLLAKSEFWKTMSHVDIAKFQMMTDRLCMPFEVFHEAIEKALNRPVFTHEFTSKNHDNLVKELFHGAPAPTFEDILKLIPDNKRCIVVVEQERPVFKLLPEERILEDDYPVYPEYVYIADGRFIRSDIQGTVQDLKRNLNAKEIRRCELFGHSGARLGDRVE